MTRYRVHVGWSSSGHDRWRRFDTLEQARDFCSRVFQRTGIVLTIEGR